MRLLHRLRRDLRQGRNLEIYLTILVALVIIVLDVLGVVAPEVIAAGTLATLALLAYSTINNREQMAEAQAQTAALTALVEENVLGKTRAEDFFVDARPDYTSDLRGAQTIYITGVTLSRTVRDYLGVFEQRLQDGATVRLIIIDPDSPATKQAALRSYRVITDGFYPNRIKPTMDLLQVLVSLPDLTGTFTLSLLSFAPSFGMALIDPDKPGGKIYVEIYQHQSFDPNPTFVLERDRDSYWFDFFHEQFKLLQSSARPAEGLQINVTPDETTTTKEREER